MDSMLYLAPVMGIVALLFAFYLASKVGKQDAGTDRMKEIAAAISDGAHAFLMSEYKILVIFVIVLFVLIGVGIGNWVTAVCFLLGGIFSTASRLLWYERGNQRPMSAQPTQRKTGGMNKALSIAFSGGAVMGMCVVGLGLLGVSVLFTW